MIPVGLSQTSGILVGQALGSNNKAFTLSISNANLLLGTFLMSLIACMYIFAPKLLISFYLNINNPANINTMHIAILLLAVTAISQIFDSIRNIVTGVLRGFKDTQIPMRVGILVTWIIGLPLSYLLAFTFHWGPVRISIAYALGFLVGAIILTQRFYRKFV